MVVMVLIRRVFVMLTDRPLEGTSTAFVNIIVFVPTPSSSGLSPGEAEE
jgi:hypothetical protein